jgi:hypothetical protein
MIILGVIITVALNVFLPGKGFCKIRGFDFLISIFITLVVWEGNLRIDHWLNKKYPWITRTRERLLIHLGLSVGYSGFIIFLASLLFNFFTGDLPPDSPGFLKTVLVILGILVLMSIILLTIEVSTQFFTHWKNSLVEIEKYRAESLQAQLQNLKNQINPHFLFNNLSVLSSLVYQDQDKSVEFISQLSKVYRYLLDNHNNELVTLQEELEFIHAYVFLMQIRFGSNLSFTIHTGQDALNRFVPPMALQILIENAIKHNEVSSLRPLSISINADNDNLTVSNNLQLRMTHEPGSKTGLHNIKSRYAFFTDKPVKVANEDGFFTVIIPLLSKK